MRLAHLKSVEPRTLLAATGIDVSEVRVARGEYYVADAEYLLAKVQAR